ncbi:MAG TPA: T9SS type A sorting domain-containing protein [Bacteroidia bacterium]|nr:T9SS type A sorting domain-containing protein [Bacteroidia bacterium]HNT80053.1 T9SS type A sorting domain-containing protein [Bacteroidia bacterium]
MKISKNVKQKQGQKLMYITASVCMMAIIAGVISFLYLNTGTSEKAYAGATAPTLDFRNPTLSTGTYGQPGSIYVFSNVGYGMDAWVTLVALNGNATVSSVDKTAMGYEPAWQPFLVARRYVDSSIDWKIQFKVAGTSTDTVIPVLAVTGVDIDGNSTNLREYIESTLPWEYAVGTPSILAVTVNPTILRAEATIANVPSIDTNVTMAMIQMNYTNVNSFNFRTGAISGSSSNQTRELSFYFKPFFTTFTPLPVELLSFTGKQNSDETVLLEWKTAAESKNDFFTLERSFDGKQFDIIAKVKGAGNSTQLNAYSVRDVKAREGVNYYRLWQTDYDGTTENLGTIRVNVIKDISGFKVSSIGPNPFGSEINISFVAEQSSEMQIFLLNMQGQVVQQKKMNASSGGNNILFENLSQLSQGSYILMIQNEEGERENIRVIKNR